MKINTKEWINSMIADKKCHAIPILTHPGIEYTGHTVKEAVTDAEVHAQAILELAERFSSSASSMIMDLTVEAEAFGAHVEFTEDDVPNITGRLVSNMDEVNALQIPTLDKGRVPVYIEANKILAAKSKKPVISGCIGPFSLAGRLYDMTEIMLGMFLEPETIHALLQKCTDFITLYCQALKDAGSNSVLLAEPAAGLLGNDQCSEFSSKYVKQIVDKIQDDNFAIFLHNCGNRGNTTEAMIETGSAGFHFGNQANMVEALEACPKDALVMGNLDPVSLFKQADSKTMYDETMALLEKCAKYPNFILSSGCDVPPHIPLENIEAFYKALSDFNND